MDVFIDELNTNTKQGMHTDDTHAHFATVDYLCVLFLRLVHRRCAYGSYMVAGSWFLSVRGLIAAQCDILPQHLIVDTQREHFASGRSLG